MNSAEYRLEAYATDQPTEACLPLPDDVLVTVSLPADRNKTLFSFPAH